MCKMPTLHNCNTDSNLMWNPPHCCVVNTMVSYYDYMQ